MLNRSLLCYAPKHQYFRIASSTRNYAARSPRTLNGRPSKLARPNENLRSVESSVAPRWPTEVFAAAYQDRDLKIPPNNVNHLLEEIWSLAQSRRLNRTNTEIALKEHMLEAKDLTMIARLLFTQRSDVRLVSLGIDCLSLSADIGDESATMILMDVATENKSYAGIGVLRYQKALAHLKVSAATKNVQSMVLLAKAYEHSSNFRDAINIYREVIEINNAKLQVGDPVLEQDRSSLADAYRNMGRLILHAPDSEDSALQNFEVAALEYEDPMSFYYMALLQGESHKDYITFLSQAAISGVTEATYELGLLYSKEGDRFDPTGKHSRTVYSKAIHWFELAQEGTKLSDRARLHIARIKQARKNSAAGSDANEIERILVNLNTSTSLEMQQFLTFHWTSALFALSAAELETKMEAM